MTSTDIERTLHAMRTTAPSGVAGHVLTEVGIRDAWTYVEAPTGKLIVAFNDHGVSGLAPAHLEHEFRRNHPKQAGRALGEQRALPARLERRLQRTLQTGKLGTLQVDLRGLTDFQRAVLVKTAEIPPGELRTYGWVAREIGNAGAVRAVGSALNRNPIPVVIPCHRVGKSDGTIGDYAYGPEMKRQLLRSEGLDPDLLDDSARRGVRFVGSDSTGIYCHPTCRNARRITEPHLVEFSGAAAATAAGYKPCLVCRPAVPA